MGMRVMAVSSIQSGMVPASKKVSIMVVISSLRSSQKPFLKIFALNPSGPGALRLSMEKIVNLISSLLATDTKLLLSPSEMTCGRRDGRDLSTGADREE